MSPEEHSLVHMYGWCYVEPWLPAAHLQFPPDFRAVVVAVLVATTGSHLGCEAALSVLLASAVDAHKRGREFNLELARLHT